MAELSWPTVRNESLLNKAGLVLSSLTDGAHVTRVHPVGREPSSRDADDESLLPEVGNSSLGTHQLVTLEFHEQSLSDTRGPDELTPIHPDGTTGLDDSLTCRILRGRSPLTLGRQRRCLSHRRLFAPVHHLQMISDDTQRLKVITLARQNVPQSLDVGVGVLAVSRWCPLRGQQALRL